MNRFYDEGIVNTPNLTVGKVADELGIPIPTLRTWDRRYGVGPSVRTPGGHRRYSRNDLERVRRLKEIIDAGVAPVVAAQIVSEVLVPNEVEVDATRRIIEATKALDSQTITEIIDGAVRASGLVRAWDMVMAPALVRIGDAWEGGIVGVEHEHLLSSRVLQFLRGQTRTVTAQKTGTVLLASAPEEQHKLPIVALEAALADRGVASLELGSRLPSEALQLLMTSVEPDIVVLWASMPREADDPVLDVLRAAPEGCEVLMAGPGWADESPVQSLREAVRFVTHALANGPVLGTND